ncbi:NADH-quinone oxidoreductase subunit N [Mucilaginibacter daejeonensis]|uniref:NADH-quinone oxidoreductase subunit N n=1 Tax=Mucilaginibacter daejeonensis TaxID=398049 RepID=UPI001D179DC3|nr:NADH-quinone oxidoreductase subunit N [Mucilaginibacter daejeonensis]UEG54757.1 NADH-quinone oxidoreductase subunit N [Mucilaginibacter daejeonensis]
MQQWPYISALLSDVMQSLPLFKPELCLTGLFLMVLAIDLIYRKNGVNGSRTLACAGILLVMVANWGQYILLDDRTEMLFAGSLILDHGTIVLKMTIDVAAFILLLYFTWDDDLKAHKKGLGDAYSIIVASVLGLHLMVMSGTLLVVFLSVEMVSIASYLLVAYRTGNGQSAEAGLKYVLFGMAASAVMLYGISLLYGLSGTLSFAGPQMAQQLMLAHPAAVMLAMLLVLAGIGFKLSFVPMHFWVPDVYQGASTPVTAYLSTLPKIAGFGLLAALVRPFAAGQLGGDISAILAVAGVVTMIAGNFAAIWQTNIKRMLAYSSIGHTGFALMAILTFNAQGAKALNFYLGAYAVANLGVLALASYFANARNAHTLDDLKGLGSKYPIASVCFVVLLVSLTGIPVSAGFNAKVLVFSAVYNVYEQAHSPFMLALLITGAVTTVVSLFYYIKVPLYLFLKRPDDANVVHPATSRKLLTLIVVLTVVVLLLGLFPDVVANFM